MYRIVKRDGRIVDFDITKISGAIKKAFEATETPEGDGVVDFLALRVTADFARKVVKFIFYLVLLIQRIIKSYWNR